MADMIDRLRGHCLTLLLSLLGTAAYLAVATADAGSSIRLNLGTFKLPILDLSVAPSTFVWVAPLLVALLHSVLHLDLVRLSALSRRSIEGEPPLLAGLIAGNAGAPAPVRIGH